MSQEFSFEDIQRMRQIIAQHEGDHKPMQTIDLNNPPKEPYKFQPFPKMVYDLDASKPGHLVTLTVRNQVELENAVADGWSEQAPAFGDGLNSDLSPKFQSEANQVQQQIEETKKRGPGRPKVA